MPNRDGTGPLHKGQGRKRGYCHDKQSSRNGHNQCDGTRRRLRRANEK